MVVSSADIHPRRISFFMYPMPVSTSVMTMIPVSTAISPLCISGEHRAAHQQHHQQYLFHVVWFLVQDRLANKSYGVIVSD